MNDSDALWNVRLALRDDQPFGFLPYEQETDFVEHLQLALYSLKWLIPYHHIANSGLEPEILSVLMS
ncbi:MAG TPA: hypothetical protein PK224_10360 [Nitrospira sp.]|nr:hypothetical protein [Nitrospira sp.]